MNTIKASLDRAQIQLVKNIDQGGQANIWELKDFPHFLAKIYKKTDKLSKDDINLYRKIDFMIKNPPKFTQHNHHQYLSWPTALIYDESGNIVGYLMRKVENSMTLEDFMRDTIPSWDELHIIAHSISSLVFQIHECGHVIADLSEGNILINLDSKDVSIIDTDSFQIFDKDKDIYYYSTVIGTPRFTAPEVLDKYEQMKFIEGDFYSLAVILHRLLLCVPYDYGTYEDLSVDQYAQKGLWISSKYPSRKLEVDDIVPSIELVRYKLQELFYKCFDDGFTNKLHRPTAKEWMEAIESSQALISAKLCESNHHYYQDKSCYWCDYLGRLTEEDVDEDFVSPTVITKNFHSTILVPSIYLSKESFMVLNISEKLLSPQLDTKSAHNTDRELVKLKKSFSSTDNNIVLLMMPLILLIITIIGFSYSEYKCITKYTDLCSEKLLISKKLNHTVKFNNNK